MDTDISNEKRADCEIYGWLKNPPVKYLAYVKDISVGQPITNWTGRTLGHITSLGKTWRSSFGDKRQSFRVLGTNGVLYSAIAYLDSGDYCRLKAVK